MNMNVFLSASYPTLSLRHNITVEVFRPRQWVQMLLMVKIRPQLNKHRYLNFEKQAMISGINTVNSNLFKVLSSLKASQNSCFIAQFVEG